MCCRCWTVWSVCPRAFVGIRNSSRTRWGISRLRIWRSYQSHSRRLENGKEDEQFIVERTDHEYKDVVFQTTSYHSSCTIFLYSYSRSLDALRVHKRDFFVFLYHGVCGNHTFDSHSDNYVVPRHGIVSDWSRRHRKERLAFICLSEIQKKRQRRGKNSNILGCDPMDRRRDRSHALLRDTGVIHLRRHWDIPARWLSPTIRMADV